MEISASYFLTGPKRPRLKRQDVRAVEAAWVQVTTRRLSAENGKKWLPETDGLG